MTADPHKVLENKRVVLTLKLLLMKEMILRHMESSINMMQLKFNGMAAPRPACTFFAGHGSQVLFPPENGKERA